MAQLPDFIRARKEFAYGETRDYWDHAQCVGWVRVGDKEHDGCAVVVSIGDEGLKHMEVGKVSERSTPVFKCDLICVQEHAGEVWTDVLHWQEGEVTIGEDGWADFKCPVRIPIFLSKRHPY